MTEVKKNFHDSFPSEANVSNSDGGKFQRAKMETFTEDPQISAAGKVSKGGNNHQKFPGVETNCFQVVSTKVSTCPACSAVVNPRWQRCLACGDVWSEEAVATKTMAAVDDCQKDFEERAAIVEFDGEIPREWSEGIARLCSMQKPTNVSATRWRQAVDAAGCFADKWAAKASALGCTTLDIFGVDQRSPEGALHTAGLVWLLQD